MTTPNHLADLLHRSRVALRNPGSWVDVPQLLAEIDAAIPEAHSRLAQRLCDCPCWCGEKTVDGQHCNQHTQFELGDG